MNALNSPWALDDLVEIVRRGRRQARRRHGAEGRGRLGHPLCRPAARPARGAGTASASRSCIHAILETAEGVKNVDDDRGRLAPHARHEPRAGRSRGVARHEDDAGRRRPSRLPRAGRCGRGRRARPAPSRTSGTTRSPAWSMPAMANGIKAFYGPFGDFSDPEACEAQFRNAFLMGCVGRLVAASEPDRDRQARVLARSGRGRVRPPDHRRHAGRHGRRDDRRQDAGRRDLEAGQGDLSTSPTSWRRRTAPAA